MDTERERGGPPDGRRGRRGARGGLESRDAAGNCAQTFRRGRAVAFLERLLGMRATLARQLREPEFESIRPVISGELKALDNVIQAFMQTFDLRDEPAAEGDSKLASDPKAEQISVPER